MISRISLFLKSWPLHVLLLPVFFMAGSYNQYAGLLATDEVVTTTLHIFAGMLIAFSLMLFFYKNKTKAGIASTVGAVFYLFFGNIKETLSKIPVLEFISHYKTLLPLLLILSTVFFYKLYKAKKPFTLNLFLNLLLIIYCGIEFFRFIKVSSSEQHIEWTVPKKTIIDTATGLHPTIFYIILDCYPNSRFQKDMLGADSNELDSYLSKKGFYIVKDSKSNYNYTPFSMASIFNMQYLDAVKDPNNVKPHHYNRTIQMIEEAVVMKKLREEQYQFTNLSNFDLPGSPALVKGKFLTTTTRQIILYNTFYKCLRRDIIPQFFPAIKSKMIQQVLKEKKHIYSNIKPYNKMMMDSLLHSPSWPVNKKPLFVYAHLIMPHFPYFFDSTGNAYPDEVVFGRGLITNRERFKNYVGYTNRQAAHILDSIIKRGNGNDIIIVQSDHGLFDLDKTRPQDAFRNYSAFYFPDRDYSLLYNSMSNVNTFRIIFNKYFGQQLPLLKDSTTFIK
jgi:hypothetical protein